MRKVPIFPATVKEKITYWPSPAQPVEQEVEYCYKVTMLLDIQVTLNNNSKFNPKRKITMFLKEDDLQKDLSKNTYPLITLEEERLKQILLHDIFQEEGAELPEEFAKLKPELRGISGIKGKKLLLGDNTLSPLRDYIWNVMRGNIYYFIQNVVSDSFNTPLGTITRKDNDIRYEVIFTYQQDDPNIFGEYSFVFDEKLPNKEAIISDPSIKSDAPSITPELIEIANLPLYHELQTVYSAKEFNTNKENPWPKAQLGEIGIAELKPVKIDSGDFFENNTLIEWQEDMVKEVIDMGDDTADALDVVSYIWLTKAKSPDSLVIIYSDDGLRMRGLKPRKNSRGYGCQYEVEQYKKWAAHMAKLQNTWITVFKMDVTEIHEGKRGPFKKRAQWGGQSRTIDVENRFGPLLLTGEMDFTKNIAWQYRLGGVFAKFLFGPGRQTALLSCEALRYNPKTQQWEKRLTRYFAWQWRIRQKNGSYLDPYKVETLISAIKEKIDERHPMDTKNRLEKALDKLQEDRVIAGWQYEDAWDENVTKKRGGGPWWKDWLFAKIHIEPPLGVTDHYKNIALHESPKKAFPAPKSTDEMDIGVERKNRNLTIMQAAEQIGISKGQLSKAERGLNVGKKTLAKIRSWFSQK